MVKKKSYKETTLPFQVVFAVHSPLLKGIFLEARSLGEEMVKVLLPDFRVEDVCEFVKFFYTGAIM